MCYQDHQQSLETWGNNDTSLVETNPFRKKTIIDKQKNNQKQDK